MLSFSLKLYLLQQALKADWISQLQRKGASKVSELAKKAVDSTIRKILVYTAEIIMAIILLVLICLPLVFTIPMWFQWVLFQTPSADLWFNPVIMFGAGGAAWLTVFIGLVSLVLSYPYVMKMLPGSTDEEDEDEEEEEEEAEEKEEDEEEETESTEDVDQVDESVEDLDEETEVIDEEKEEASN
jgi:hypothetical protein